MPGETLIFDPVGEDAGNAPLRVPDDLAGVSLLAHAYPTPETETQNASSVDTEGERPVSKRPRNRRIPLRLRLVEPQVNVDASTIVNLVRNPRFAIDTAGWTNVSTAAVLARATDWAAVGAGFDSRAASLAVTAAGVGAGVAIAAANSDGATTATMMPVTPGKRYSFAAALKNVNVPASLNRIVRLRWVTAGAATISSSDTSDNVATNGDVRRLSLENIAAPDTAAFAEIRVILTNNTGAAATIDIRVGVAWVVQSPTLPLYNDGDSPAWRWDGTAHNSTSRGPRAPVANLLFNPRPAADTIASGQGWNTNESLNTPGSPTIVDDPTSPTGQAIAIGYDTSNDPYAQNDAGTNIGRLNHHLLPGDWVCLAAAIKANAAAQAGVAAGADRANIGAWFRDSNGGTYVAANPLVDRANTDWQRVAITVQIPNTADATFVRIHGRGNSIADAESRFAGLMLARGSTQAEAEAIAKTLAGASFGDGDTPGWDWNSAHSGVGARLTSFSATQPSDGSRLLAIRHDLAATIAKLDREGGTLRRVLPSGDAITFDILGARITEETDDKAALVRGKLEIACELDCAPYGRGDPITLSDHAETTLPALILTERDIKGDVPALGRLVIDDDQGADQWWVTWGIQSRHTDLTATGALLLEAETQLPLDLATVAAGPAGASGSGTNTVLHNNLPAADYAGVVSTNALTHIGSFRVYTRVQVPVANQGIVTCALDWAVGDILRYTRNAPVTLNTPTIGSSGHWNGTWRLIDLGLITIPTLVQGVQRWVGRLIAKSSVAGDDIFVDYLLLVPVDEGSGTASAAVAAPSPSAGPTIARDEFNQSAGALTGKTPAVGGVWTNLSGPATDFQVSGVGGGNVLSRTAISDGNQRQEHPTMGAYTDTLVQVDMSRSNNQSSAETGVLARIVDANNYLALFLEAAGSLVGIRVQKRVAGSLTDIDTIFFDSFDLQPWLTLRAYIDTAGRVFVWLDPQGQPPVNLIFAGYDAVLATGGALASGKVGILDRNGGAIACTRNFDNFVAYSVSHDAALAASKSLEVRHDRVIRQTISGYWFAPGSYEGDYLLVPPSGREQRIARIVVKACRNDPAKLPDPAIDDISARLTITPRYLAVPDPA